MSAIRSEEEIFNDFINSQGMDRELEVRFSSFFHQTSGILPQEYFHIINSFESAQVFNITTEYPHSGNLRRRVTKDQRGGVSYTYEIKEKIDNYISKEHGYKLVLSKEEKSTKSKIVLDTSFSSVSFIRTKNRHQQIIKDGKLAIDATEVAETKRNETTTRYELELEIIDKSCTFQDFQDGIRYVFGLLYQTRFMFTRSELLEVQAYSHKVLNDDKKKYTPGNLILPLQEARSLKYEDLVSGGVVYDYEGTPNHVSGDTKRLTSKMTISLKADGMRKLCVVYKGNLWLIYRKEANLVLKDTLSAFNGSIFEGELITYDHLRVKEGPKDLLRFLAYDTLFYQEQDMREEYHSGRLKRATTFAHSIGANTNLSERQEIRSPFDVSTRTINVPNKADIMAHFLFSVKETYYFDNASEFFSQVNYLLDTRIQKVYRDDGLILTPAHEPYFLRKTTGNRTLKLTPDICKWKEPEKLTIDVHVIFDRSVPIGFKTSDNRKIDGINKDNIDVTSFTQFSKDLVYEMAFKNGLWRVERIRRDKPFTNTFDTIISNLKLLRKGNIIYEETIRGHDAMLFRKYQNRVKRNLYEENPGYSLLDIGSGFGGDIGKWENFQKIVAVEPNIENIKEFQRRYRNMKGGEVIVLTNENYKELLPEVKQERVIILQSGGENHKLITEVVKVFIGGQVDIISSMFSMSFFWKNNDMLQGLLKTIASNLDPDIGKFIFATINGENVREIFEPLFQVGMNLEGKAKFGETYVEYKPELSQLYLYSEKPWQINPRKVTSSIEFIDPKENKALTNIYLDFGGNNYLQKTADGVLVNFEGTIVNEQKEYLVDLDDISRVCPIEYVETTSKEQFLPIGLYQLASMYSAGVASFTEPVYKPFAKNKLRTIYSEKNISIQKDTAKGLYTDFTPIWWSEDNLVRIKTETGTIKECILKVSNKQEKLNLPDEFYYNVFDNTFELIILSPIEGNHVRVNTFLEKVEKKDPAHVLVLIENSSIKGKRFDILGQYHSDEKVQVIFKTTDILIIICKLVYVYQELLQTTYNEVNDYAFIFLLEKILFNQKEQNINQLIRDEIKTIKHKAETENTISDDYYDRTFASSYLLSILNQAISLL